MQAWNPALPRYVFGTPVLRSLLQERWKRKHKFGRYRTKSFAYSGITWQVNLWWRRSVIREETKRDHPPHRPLRYLLQKKEIRKDNVGKYCRKGSACPKITRQVSLPERLSVIRQGITRHLALFQRLYTQPVSCHWLGKGTPKSSGILHSVTNNVL